MNVNLERNRNKKFTSGDTYNIRNNLLARYIWGLIPRTADQLIFYMI